MFSGVRAARVAQEGGGSGKCKAQVPAQRNRSFPKTWVLGLRRPSSAAPVTQGQLGRDSCVSLPLECWQRRPREGKYLPPSRCRSHPLQTHQLCDPLQQDVSVCGTVLLDIDRTSSCQTYTVNYSGTRVLVAFLEERFSSLHFSCPPDIAWGLIEEMEKCQWRTRAAGWGLGLCGRRGEEAALRFPWTCNLMDPRTFTGLRNHRGVCCHLCTCWENGDRGDVVQKALYFVLKHGLLRGWPCSLQKQPSRKPGRIWNCCTAALPEGWGCPWLLSATAVHLDPLKRGQLGESSQRECHLSPWSGARTQEWTFLKISHSHLGTMLLSPRDLVLSARPTRVASCVWRPGPGSGKGTSLDSFSARLGAVEVVLGGGSHPHGLDLS